MREEVKQLAFHNYQEREPEVALGLLDRGYGSRLSHPSLKVSRILNNSSRHDLSVKSQLGHGAFRVLLSSFYSLSQSRCFLFHKDLDRIFYSYLKWIILHSSYLEANNLTC